MQKYGQKNFLNKTKRITHNKKIDTFDNVKIMNCSSKVSIKMQSKSHILGWLHKHLDKTVFHSIPGIPPNNEKQKGQLDEESIIEWYYQWPINTGKGAKLH